MPDAVLIYDVRLQLLHLLCTVSSLRSLARNYRFRHLLDLCPRPSLVAYSRSVA